MIKLQLLLVVNVRRDNVKTKQIFTEADFSRKYSHCFSFLTAKIFTVVCYLVCNKAMFHFERKCAT